MTTRISIDAEKCKKEGLCVQLCPMVFRQKDRDSVPEVADAEACFLCGHCIAVCPGDAISHRRLDMDNFPKIEKKAWPQTPQLIDFLRARRSVRRYKDKRVPREVIAQLLESARYAPTGCNAQSLEHIVIQDRKTIDALAGLCIDEYRKDVALAKDESKLAALPPDQAERLRAGRPDFEWLCAARDAGNDLIFYRAPGLLVTHAERRITFCPVEDSTLAACHMMLAAQSLGLGTCLIGWFYPKADKSRKIRERLGVPPQNDITMAFTFGYPDVPFRRLVDRNVPKVRWIGG